MKTSINKTFVSALFFTLFFIQGVHIVSAEIIDNGGFVNYAGQDLIDTGGYVNFTGSEGITNNNGFVNFTGSNGIVDNNGYVNYTGQDGIVNNDGFVNYTGSTGVVNNGGYVNYTVSNGIVDNNGYVNYTGVGLFDNGGYINYTGYGISNNGGYVNYAGSNGVVDNGGYVNYTGSTGLIDNGGYVNYTGNSTGIINNGGYVNYTGTNSGIVDNGGYINYTGSTASTFTPGTGVFTGGNTGYGVSSIGSTGFGYATYGYGSSWVGGGSPVTVIGGGTNNTTVQCPLNSTYSGSGTTCNCNSGYSAINGSCQLATNTLTCPANSSNVNGTCQCNAGYTFVVGSNLCTPIAQNPSCPANSSLVGTTCQCNSGYILNNGVCQITGCLGGGTSCIPSNSCTNTADAYTQSFYNNYPTCTKLCTNGSVVASNTLCPGAVTPTPVCPAGSTYVNGSCQVTGYICPTGSYLSNGVCVNTTTVYYQTCWNGTTIPTTSVCPSQYKVCANGVSVPVDQSCYKTCSNGSTVPDYQTCYRTCSNGTTVLESQACPYIAQLPWVDLSINTTQVPHGGNATLTWVSQNASYCTATNGWVGAQPLSGSEVRYNIGQATMYVITCYNSVGQSATDSVTVYTSAVNVKFNNVVTSPVSQITHTSARCNGVGLIANNVPSTGWFEYGETSNLGRDTSKTSIGSAATAPFSNTLTNLKPSTTYYCRAVMNNQYGTVKGEIVRFTTKAKATTYVAPVTVKRPVTKKPLTKNEFICADGSIATLQSVSTTKLVTSGQKLVNLTLESTSGELAISQEVSYRLVYRNISDTELSNAVIEVSIPSDITFISATAGSYDSMSKTLTVTRPRIGANEEAVISWTGKVAKNAQVGKTVVTTAHIVYTIPATGTASQIQEEVSAYIVGTILSDTSSNKAASTTGAKHVIGAGNGQSFLPDSLIEWLALIAIIFIILVLGRSIAASYAGDKSH